MTQISSYAHKTGPCYLLWLFFSKFQATSPSSLYESLPGNIHVTFRVENQNNGETEAIASVNKKFNFYIPGKLQASFTLLF